MQRKNILANMLLSVDKIENNENGVGVLNCRDTENNPMKISLYIESDETVKVFGKSKKYNDASIEHWNKYLNSLVEANYNEDKLIESYNKELSKKSDQIDIKIEGFEEIEASRDLTDEESSNLKALKAEKREIRAAKENPSDYLASKKEEIKQQVQEKKLFMFGGIQRKINNDGTASYSAELPHPEKTVRNIKSPRSGVAIDYSLTNNGEILTLGEARNPDLDYSNVKLKSTLSKNNTKDSIESVFMVNENTIDKILNDEKYGKMFYTKRLLNVYGQNELGRELYEFKKSNQFEDLDFKKIEKLKDIYTKIKEDILTNGLENYEVGIVIQANENQIKSLTEQFKNSLENGFFVKSLVKGEIAPDTIKLEKITGIQSVPTYFKNGVNLADQWYAAKSFATNIFAPSKEPINKIEVEMFGSVKINEQIDKECGIEIKKNEIKHSEQEVEDVNSMER